MALKIASGHSGLSTVRQVHGSRWDHVVSVPVVPMWEVIKPRSTDRIMFKIDVEGADLDALRGMEPMLRMVSDWAGLIEVVHIDAAAKEYLLNNYNVPRIGKADRRFVRIYDPCNLIANDTFGSNAVVRPMEGQ